MQIKLNKINTFFSKSFAKSFKKLDSFQKKFILVKLEKILEGEEGGKIRKLKNYPLAEYRLKIGDFRLLFNFDKKKDKVLFIACSHRKNLY